MREKARARQSRRKGKRSGSPLSRLRGGQVSSNGGFSRSPRQGSPLSALFFRAGGRRRKKE